VGRPRRSESRTATINETCRVLALWAWFELLPPDHGPVFRPFDRGGHIRPTRLRDEWVAQVVKRYVQSIGMDPDHFASHSLRAGLRRARADNTLALAEPRQRAAELQQELQTLVNDCRATKSGKRVSADPRYAHWPLRSMSDVQSGASETTVLGRSARAREAEGPHLSEQAPS
jgi:hypothetical protein